MENKSCSITVTIEPSFFALVCNQAELEGKSVSGYVRGLIVWELVKNGTLDTNKLATIVSGDSVSAISRLIEANRLRENLEKAEMAAT